MAGRTVRCGGCGARLPHISMAMFKQKGPDYEKAMAVRLAHVRECHPKEAVSDGR